MTTGYGVDAAAARSHGSLAGQVAAGTVGATVGLAGTVVATLVTRGRHTSLPLAPRLLLGASASAGAALLVNAGGGGGALGQRIADATWGRRHKAAFALRNLHRPHVLAVAHRSYADARAMEARLFGPGRHGDDGIDALRHAYAAGLLAARLVHDRGMSAEAATAVVDAAGRAHELDADPDDRHALSSRMDLHNNMAGAAVGTRVAASGSSDAGAVFDGVRAELEAGRLVVLDGGQLRPSRPADLPARALRPSRPPDLPARPAGERRAAADTLLRVLVVPGGTV